MLFHKKCLFLQNLKVDYVIFDRILTRFMMINFKKLNTMKQGLKFMRFFVSVLLLAVSTLSWAYDFYKGGIYCNYTGGNNVEVVRYSGDYYSGTVVIPSSVVYNKQNYTVTSIDNYTFSGCSGLKSVTIGSGVTSIGGGAFSGCPFRTVISKPITPSGFYSAFSDATYLHAPLYVPEGTYWEYVYNSRW